MKKEKNVSLSALYKLGLWEMAELSKIFNHPVMKDAQGTLRWKQNQLVRYLTDISSTANAIVDLNELCRAFHNKQFTVEEYAKFYMGMGYSLGGFAEVFGQCEGIDWDLPRANKKSRGVADDHYIETPIDYMIRVHKGKRL